MDVQSLADRIEVLEARVRRQRRLMMVVGVAGVSAAIGLGLGRAEPQTHDLIKARRILIMDAQGRERIEIGAPIVDPLGTNRIFTNEAGIIIRDHTGAERFGMGHTSVNSVTMGFDAPEGAGSPMRDRIGIGVSDTGAAWINLINNETGIPVRLVSEADNTGGIEFVSYEYGPDGKPVKAIIKRLGGNGEEVSEVPMGG